MFSSTEKYSSTEIVKEVTGPGEISRETHSAKEYSKETVNHQSGDVEESYKAKDVSSTEQRYTPVTEPKKSILKKVSSYGSGGGGSGGEDGGGKGTGQSEERGRNSDAVTSRRRDFSDAGGGAGAAGSGAAAASAVTQAAAAVPAPGEKGVRSTRTVCLNQTGADATEGKGEAAAAVAAAQAAITAAAELQPAAAASTAEHAAGPTGSGVEPGAQVS